MLCAGHTYSIAEYLEDKDSLIAKIQAIEVLIENMILSMADAIGTSGTAEYSLDDGQIKIRTVYRSVGDITEGVKALETMKQMYLNKLNGRVTLLRDLKVFRR